MLTTASVLDIVLIVFLLLVTVGMVFVAYEGLVNALRIWRTPLTSIADLTSGFAAVSGRVISEDDPLEAPMTGRNCVYFLLKTSSVTGGDIGDASSEEAVIDCQSVPIRLDDGTGTIELELDYTSPMFPDDEKCRVMLDVHGGTLDETTFARALQKYPDSGWLNEYKTLSKFGGTKRDYSGSMFSYEESIINYDENLLVFGQVTGYGNTTRIHSGNGPFIITTKTRESLLERYAWNAVGCILGTLFLAGVFAYLFVNSL